ncbi:MAG: dihydrofolate reductase [Eudoraea sp.]|nr:dihydrofolate reductase [Eudoraea sp.]
MGKIIMIAAIGKNNALGKDNDLLWHLPDDFKRFKQLTTGHKIIMGRKTFESFPKPLPNRTHIIITRDPNYNPDMPSCIVVHSIEEALKLVKDDDISYIIGGGEIYDLGMPYADILEVTRINESFDADTYFPKIDEKIWALAKEEYHPIDERHKYDFTYLTYHRDSL